ncbi:MAG TPA: hypothetical protein VJI12_01765 [archaeon]|nr:hypothetical protein [archaeon]
MQNGINCQEFRGIKFFDSTESLYSYIADTGQRLHFFKQICVADTGTDRYDAGVRVAEIIAYEAKLKGTYIAVVRKEDVIDNRSSSMRRFLGLANIYSVEALVDLYTIAP